jgi:hypothetical protein
MLHGPAHGLARDAAAAARHDRAAAARTTSVPERTYLTTKAPRVMPR